MNVIYADAELERELSALREQGLKTSPLRLEYEAKVRALPALAEALRAEGGSEEAVARALYEARRELGRLYKEAVPPRFRQYIYAATAEKYGDPLGPSYEALRRRKTCAEIIESASRPIANLDDRLTLEGFVRWVEAQREGE